MNTKLPLTQLAFLTVIILVFSFFQKNLFYSSRESNAIALAVPYSSSKEITRSQNEQEGKQRLDYTDALISLPLEDSLKIAPSIEGTIKILPIEGNFEPRIGSPENGDVNFIHLNFSKNLNNTSNNKF